MDWTRTIPYSDDPISIGRVPDELGHLLVTRVVGSSMEPRLRDGDQVIFDPKQRHPEDGQMVVVSRGSELLTRWARRRPDGRLAFVSEDGTELAPDDEPAVVAGTVLLFVREPWLSPMPWPQVEPSVRSEGVPPATNRARRAAGRGRSRS